MFGFVLPVLALFATTSSQAIPVTLSGNTVEYTFDDSLMGLFGTPSISGDTLFFTPVNFETQSLNGSGFALENETVNIKVSTHTGYRFGSVNLIEKGDYLLLGPGSDVDVTGQIRVFDTANPLMDITDGITPLAPLNLTGIPTRNWEASAMVDMSSWTNTTEINITVQNLLLAVTTAPSSLAFVEKKFIGLSTSVSPVPEVETWAMMLAGVGLIGLQLRRSKRSSARIIR
ncbi:MAG: hypothetical protein HXY27_02175 [Hydrogenophilaceae bacterium]|nr:hypothetical protein [Hydrogenophilaceae bacterium]